MNDTIFESLKDFAGEYEKIPWGSSTKGEGNLMAWVQSKITNAVEMLDGVSDYLQSQHKTASDKNKGKKLNKPFPYSWWS